MPRTRAILTLLAILSCGVVLAQKPVLMHRAPDTTPPTLVSAVIATNGTTVTVTFSESVVGASANGFTFTPSGDAATLTYSSGSGTSALVFTASRTIYSVETATISYSSTTGDVTDTVGNDLASFGATAVTNNSTTSSGVGFPIIENPEPLVIADEGSISFTPTVLQGTGLTFTASDLPTGASINSSTGEITGTLSTTGIWRTKITATNSIGADTVRLLVQVSAGTTTIDSTWLTANGPAPYLLPTANTTYVLGTDVTVDGCGFVIGAANIALDLNGHTITYDNATQVVLANGGFETQGASASLAANWDFTNGTNITRTSRTQPYLWGSYMLNATGFTGSQYIQSDTITLSSSAQRYSAIVYTKGNIDGNGVTISIVESGNESNVLASGSASDSSRGLAARADWQRSAGAPTAVKVRITVAHTSSSEYVYLDFASLRYSDNVAVWGAGTATDAPVQLTAGSLNAELNDATTWALIDRTGGGAITQANRSYKSAAIYSQVAACQLYGPFDISVNGMDTKAVDLKNGNANALVEGVTITADAEAIPRRLSAYGLIHATDTMGANLIVARNTITGSAHIGIDVARQFTAGSPARITDPLIEENNFDDYYELATDGYCIVLNAVDGAVVRRNAGVVANGRGILLDGFGTSGSVDVVIGSPDETDLPSINEWWGDEDTPNAITSTESGDGNFFVVKERANLEYDNRLGMEATGLRMRYFNATNPLHDADAAHQNVKCIGNYFAAYTDEPPDGSLETDKWNYCCKGASVMTGEAAASQCYIVRNNTFKAVVLNVDATLTGNKPSTALAWVINDSQGVPTVENEYTDNVFESNHICIAVGDGDTAGGNFAGHHNFFGSTFIDSADGEAMTHAVARVGDFSQKIQELGIYSSIYSGGAVEDVTWSGPTGGSPAGSTVKFGDRLTVHVEEADNDPISGATVTIDNNQTTEVFSGSTDAGGDATATLARITLTHNGTSETSVDHNPFDIEAVKSGYTTNSSLNYSLSGDATETITLSP